MADGINLKVGEYKKNKSEGLECDKCHVTVDIVYEVSEPQIVGGEVNKNYCYSCYQKFWLERGYRV